MLVRSQAGRPHRIVHLPRATIARVWCGAVRAAAAAASISFGVGGGDGGGLTALRVAAPYAKIDEKSISDTLLVSVCMQHHGV